MSRVAKTILAVSIVVCGYVIGGFADHASAATTRVQIGIAGTAQQYRTAGVHPTIHATYGILPGSDWHSVLAGDSALHATPLITWDPWTAPLAQIAGGAYDEYLLDSAQAARAYGGPIYVRLAQEMNGNWFPWSNNPTTYVAAWRHLVKLFRHAGARNVRWVWGPDLLTWFTENVKESTTSPYWPGARYVDLIGPTLVQFASESACEITCRMQTVDWLHATYHKPIWFAETKVDAAERYAWLGTLVTALRARPWIRAVVWTEYPSRGQATGQANTGEMNWQLPSDARARRLLLRASEAHRPSV
jgi:hypothetical protein